MKMKKKLLVSFSGGRTSAYMLWWILNVWQDRNDYEIIICFANTGKEHPGTLDFVKTCAEKWNVEIIWLEGEPKYNPPRKIKSGKNKGKMTSGGWWGVIPHVVDYGTADREGKVFERFISKLGIPGPNNFWCSKQMKRRTITAYLRQIGWSGYYVAVGMRYDEPDRITYKDGKKRYMYLLHDNTVMSKWDILAWWKQESGFDLDIPKNMGNCDNCPKKGHKVLCDNATNQPATLGWWQEMTDNYGHLNPRNTHLKPPFNFYYGNKSPVDMIKMAIEMSSNEINNQDFPVSDCAESCEAF